MPRSLTLEPLPSTQRPLSLTPDLREKLDAFVASNPFLVESIQQIPRAALEERFLLNRMVQEEMKANLAPKLLEWLNAEPEMLDVQQVAGHVESFGTNLHPTHRATLAAV